LRSRTKDAPVLLELSAAQVDRLLETAGQESGIQTNLFGLELSPKALNIEAASLEDPRLSRSLLAGLLVLAAFPADRSYVGNAAIAESLDMSVTSAHRYVSTLFAAGLLERDPDTRKYRRAR
jgi:DNA-binding MarR family transcriptional regulator